MKHTLSRFTTTLLTITAFALILLIVSTAKAVTVDTTADDASLSACTNAPKDCSLRGAIATAASGATINFDTSVFASAQTITLNGTELAIGKNLTITGTGANLLSINGNVASRVFEITGAFTVVLEKMTITNGKTFAVACEPSNTRRGAGIYSAGNLTLNSVVVSNNTAVNASSGIFNTNNSIANNGTLNVNNSTISGNTASGGGISQANGGNVNINNSSVINNTASGGGGGIGSVSAITGILTITNSTVSGNSTTSNDGGGIAREFATTPFYNMIIKNSTIANNTAGAIGGGIYVSATQTNSNSQFLIENSTLSGNDATAQSGGGIYVAGTFGDFINSTVSANKAAAEYGGGGGIVIDSFSKVNLLNTIVAGNSVAGNTAAATSDIFSSVNSFGGEKGLFVSYGTNLIGINDDSSAYTTASGASGDQIGTSANPINAKLKPLGGATMTHALLSDSPAVNTGNDCVKTSTCMTLNPQENLTTDQRGVSRVNTVDIGAFEFIAGRTAAGVTVGGRVMTASGRGIANVRITMTGASGEVRTATTSAFGYYRFTDVAAGATYIISASGKRFGFAQQSQVLNVTEDVNEANFIGDSTNPLKRFRQ